MARVGIFENLIQHLPARKTDKNLRNFAAPGARRSEPHETAPPTVGSHVEKDDQWPNETTPKRAKVNTGTPEQREKSAGNTEAHPINLPRGSPP